MLPLVKDRHGMGSRYSWDRRSTTTSAEEQDSSNNFVELPVGCVKYFVAGHLLRRRDRKRYRAYASTYLSFSPDGTELLTNLGSEQIYLFDVLKPSKPKFYEMESIQKNGYHKDTSGSVSNGYHLNGMTSSHTIKNLISKTYFKKTYSHKNALPSIVDKIKTKANERFECNHFTFAIHLYNKAISMCPRAAVLFGNRAMAYMKRKWEGDFYAALRDCYTALAIDTDYYKAHYRLVRCLYDLEWYREAADCFEVFRDKFPEQSDNELCNGLNRDIQKAITTKLDNKSNSPRNGSSTEPSLLDSNNGYSHYNMTNAANNQEKEWRVMSFDYKLRYCGHCNTTTDIKEANFLGRYVLYFD